MKATHTPPATGPKRPLVKPNRPYFSSGPCAKPPTWSLDSLQQAFLGRSHRAAQGKQKLAEVINLSQEILGIPNDWHVAIVPASDTGAVEMALWSLLGPNPVEAIGFESFGEGWINDLQKQLKLPHLKIVKADYGKLPDLKGVNSLDHDVVFTWNGTTSGVVVPHGDWIAQNRNGLVICDATSAVFAYDLPWSKLDVVTWSWQKVLGGEGAHGMIALSPRAVTRLETYSPPWPMPKIFRMTSGGKLTAGLFLGETINTPSMLCVEDALFGLHWAKQQGGMKFLSGQTARNLAIISEWVEKTPWIEFLAEVPAQRSSTSICLKISGACPLPEAEREKLPATMAKLLEKEGVAYDINAYRDAPPGLRIWGGATVETDDIAKLCPWLDWAYATACLA